MNECTNVIQEVQRLLTANPEWENRYQAYLEKINQNARSFAHGKDRFHVPAPFGLYMSFSDAVNRCTEKKAIYELRYCGQSVAKLHAPADAGKAVTLEVKKDIGPFPAGTKMDWNNSEEAKQFRKLYKDALPLRGQPEHSMESELLQNYALKSSAGKEIPNIQPVMMTGTNARFQMPTPLGASMVKKGADKLKYAGFRGGGIDILARVGTGRTTTLAVLELKDKPESSEPPKKAIRQAVAYATFLRALLRSSSGDRWWGFFGLGGNVPKELTIKAIVVMNDDHNQCSPIPVEKLSVDGDYIQTGYIYRKPNGVIYDF